jgi:outer membrane protein
MKKVLILLATVLAFGVTNVMAQKKMGYLNSQELLTAMPEYKKVNDSLESFYKKLDQEFGILANEYQAKIKKYEEESKTFSESMKEVKIKEIQSLEQRMQEFKASSSEKLQKKEAELLNPLLDKVQKAIDDVGKEQNFDYIYNEQALLYAKDSENITSLVKAKLGIK